MKSGRISARSSLWLALTLATVAFAPARAQSDAAPRPLLRQLYNDLAIEISPAPGGGLRLGAADATRAIALSLLPQDLLRWADSAKTVLSKKLRRSETSGHWRAVVEEPGVNSGTMVLARNIQPTDTTITIFVADGDFNSVETTVDEGQALAFIGAVRRVASASRQAARDKKKPPRPRDTPPRPAGVNAVRRS